jgi:nucleotide-binding universal stress UspA family protein
MVKKILIATDGSQTASDAVELGAELAARFAVPVVLIHVLLRDHLSEALRHMAEVEYEAAEGGRNLFEVVSAIPQSRFPMADLLPEQAQTEDGLLRAVAEGVLDVAERVVRGHGVEQVECMVADGDASRRIIEASEEVGADMIVIGARGLSDLQALMVGSVSHKVQNLSPVTVVSVR